jgi:hypothetical protein
MKNWQRDTILKAYEMRKAIERYQNVMELLELGDEE